MLILFLPVFLVLLLLGMPVFFAMLSGPGIMLYVEGMDRDIPLLFRNIYNGIDSFPLMAIPFFMLAGELMNQGGITMRLVAFAQSLIGHVRGGLADIKWGLVGATNTRKRVLRNPSIVRVKSGTSMDLSDVMHFVSTTAMKEKVFIFCLA